uniref:Uncharacterized protein n=1 Tax=Rhizophora mucronata TaxID=61149 RepID=A0A2P2QDK0_RHIMU
MNWISSSDKSVMHVPLVSVGSISRLKVAQPTRF